MKVIEGDCRNASFPPNYFDTIITDPPYGLEFMGKDWDAGVPGVVFWEKFLRWCKPGAFALVFGGTRTFHRLTCAIEDAGWEIRDCMMWLYGSGFPKSLDISKALDKAAGIWRGKAGEVLSENTSMAAPNYERIPKGSPSTDLAKLWDGWGTALKPAWEPIIVAMKPLDGTFANNAEKHGVAGLWIDGGRIGTETRFNQKAGNPTDRDTAAFHAIPNPNNYQGKEVQGRWPANLILDEEAGAMLDEQSGMSKPRARREGVRGGKGFGFFDDEKSKNATGVWPEDNGGGASRFFYCAKASKSERGESNAHPTVKPLALMECLCKLTKTPTGGRVLDPFGGSGTTALACLATGRDCVMVEKEPAYCEIARKRIDGFRPA